jgi:hypothetical protein
MKANTRILFFEKEKLIFQFFNHGQKQDEIVLNSGYELVANTYFKNDIPSEEETEYAINFIEDELMSNKKLVSNNEELVIQSQIVEEVFHKYTINQKVIQRQEIEDLFSKIARVVMRKYATEGLEITRESFAVLLLIREITHHLKFNYITFSLDSDTV